MKAQIGLIGLAVMGENLVLNMANKGYSVAVFNRTLSAVDSFLAGRANGKCISGTYSIEELVHSVEKPRKIMMMVKAGKPVDETIDKLLAYMEPGDIIIDGGNSYFEDTERRTRYVEGKGLYYIGTGVSGGEEGALHGPSIMPGGSCKAWPAVQRIFQDIAAKTEDGTPCCDWIGPGGAGHFVKMVHNGIEYGDMQLISEIFWIMKHGLRMDYQEIHQVFDRWKNGRLDSYLIQITSDILGYTDEDGTPLLNKILDSAGQKGTGRWTGIAALNANTPLTLIVESVFARSLSSQKEQRLTASKVFPNRIMRSEFSKNERNNQIHVLESALYCAKIVSYAQGFELIGAIGKERDWNLDLGNIALLWRGGCIIRSSFLNRIKEAYVENPTLQNLILSSYFSEHLKSAERSWRQAVASAFQLAVPIPALAASLAWFDGYRSAELPANLIQAQRDYFGAHTYERTDRPRGEFHHTNWTGHGGDTVSTSYCI